MKFKWILFDADNTLFDYDAAERGALGSTFEEMGRPLTDEHRATYREINHQNWQAYERGEITQAVLRVRRFAQYLNSLGLPDDPEQVSKRYLFHLGNRTDLVEGAEALVEALESQVNMMIITNGLRDVQRARFGQSTIGRYFKNMVISEEVGFAKPDGRIFDVAFDLMGQPDKSEVIIVGDSLTSDIQGGLNYGIATCWFNPNKRANNLGLGVDVEIGRLDELLNLF